MLCCNHAVQDDSKTPNIRFMISWLALKHFWRHKRYCATFSAQGFSLRLSSSKPEVPNLYFRVTTVGAEKDVEQLEVSMNEPLLMNIVYTSRNLQKNVTSSLFWQPLALVWLFKAVGKQISSFCVLAHNVRKLIDLERIDKAYDILATLAQMHCIDLSDKVARGKLGVLDCVNGFDCDAIASRNFNTDTDWIDLALVNLKLLVILF